VGASEVVLLEHTGDEPPGGYSARYHRVHLDSGEGRHCGDLVPARITGLSPAPRAGDVPTLLASPLPGDQPCS
jgi:hypothetical protein